MVAAICLLQGVFAFAGCGNEPMPIGAGRDASEITCSACHGSDENEAPPRALDESVDPAGLGVGAHQAHLTDSALSLALSCDSCHVVPETIGAAGHVDPLPAEVTFTAFAATGGLEPSWDRTAGRCSNVYCHGATLSGGEATAPLWTRPDGSQTTCSGCHGNPPPPPHPASTSCELCHGQTVSTPGVIDLASGQHIDGEVDAIVDACDVCHGDETSPAPPIDTQGNTETTATGVGAHRSHLGVSDWHVEVTCDACHVVPQELGDVGHIDSELPAELAWGTMATLNAAAPSWDGTSCAGSYCHGATLEAPQGDPSWTQVDGTFSLCSACHGDPPPAPHVQATDCERCHPAAGPNGTIAQPALHIDGKVDLSDDACAGCHGDETSPAPPYDTNGHDDPTLTGVGAHRSHLGTSDWHEEVACAACHVVPTTIDAVGHQDTELPAELTWGPQATRRGATPTWDSASCANTYCHGTTLGDGGSQPQWTDQSGDEKACDACHGNPPTTGVHPNATDCERCHPSMDANGDFIAPEFHINGALDLTETACWMCHGDETSPAPPLDTDGAIDTTLVSVGAHRSHVGASASHAEVLCETCHLVPNAYDDPGHVDTPRPAEVMFGPQASLAGATQPAWSEPTCSDTYCHGATFATGDRPPVWTQVDGTFAACDACHGNPPPLPHPPRSACGTCHPTVDANLNFLQPELHVDGHVDIAQLACNFCHGDTASDAPPADTLGNNDPSFTGVGAHRSHLGTSLDHAEVLCVACHTVPVAMADPGHRDDLLPAELVWGPQATGWGATSPSWNGTTCSSVYCHGASLAEGGFTPTWTSVDTGQAACGTCHGAPPAAPHVQSPDCYTCHAEVIASDRTFIEPTKHIDGTLQATANHPAGWAQVGAHGVEFTDHGGPAACTSCHGAALTGGVAVSCDSCHVSSTGDWTTDCVYCHGGTDNATGAPPEGVGGELVRTAPEVGAHTSHVEPTAKHAGFACTKCHLEPTSIFSAGHIDGDGVAEVVFDSQNTGGSYTGVFCSSIYCHGSGRASDGQSPNWTSDPTLGCADCHGDDVTGSQSLSGSHAGHFSRGYTDCSECHANVVDSSKQIIDTTKHVNEAADVSILSGSAWAPATKTCATISCHKVNHGAW